MTVAPLVLLLGLVGLVGSSAVALRGVASSDARRGGLRLSIAALLPVWALFVARYTMLSVGGNESASTQWVLVGFVVLALLAMGYAWRRGLYALVTDGGDRWLLACTLGALGLRLAYPPQILHVERFGGALLDAYHGFPEVPVTREAYGQVSFVILGILARMGGHVNATPHANALFSAALVPLTGLLARRWTGSRVAAIVAALVLAVHPAFLRVGASEDAHTLGVLLLASALLAFDVAAVEGSGRALAAGTLLAVLAGWTRQSLVPLLFMPYVAFAERAGWHRLRQGPLVASALATGGTALAHVLKNARLAHNEWLYCAFDAIFEFPERLLAEPHPLLDTSLAPFPVPLLVLAGLIALAWRSRVRVAPALGFVVLGLVSLPMSAFGPGVQLAFRLPFLYVAILVAAVGAEGIAHALRGRPTLRLALFVAGATSLAVFSTLGALRFSGPDPQTDELLFLERTLPRLDPGTVVVTPNAIELFHGGATFDPRPPWRLPVFLAERSHVVTRSVSDFLEHPPGPQARVLFYKGLGCSVVTLAEGSPRFREAFEGLFVRRDASATRHDLMRAVYDTGDLDRLPSPELLPRLRTACYGVPWIGDPLGPAWSTVLRRSPEAPAPSMFLPLEAMEIGFYRVVEPSASAARPARLTPAP